MDIKAQAEKAEKLRKLHHGPRILALPNAWDVVSARILEELGHPTIATSSAAVAFSLGYPDGQRISRGEMLDAVRRITGAVRVPVTADLESGYGKTPEEIAEFTKAVVGSHRQYRHPTKPGIVTVAGHPGVDVPPGTLNSALKQAGLKKPRE